jgi:hypothetical protein
MESARARQSGELIAVFPTPEAARRAAERLGRARLGDVVVDESLAAVARGEMAEELDHTWGGGLLGTFVTDEMARPALLLAGVLALVGAAIGAGLTVAIASAPAAWWARAVVGGAVGGLFLGAVGAIVGGGMGSRDPSEDVGSGHEAAVRVRGETAATVAQLRLLHPVRIDRFLDGQYQETIAGETPPAAHRLGHGIADPTSR